MKLLHVRVLALTAAMFFSSNAATAENQPYARRNPIVDAVKKTRTGIVTVKTPRVGGGKDMTGTGVIVDERGYIVTNRHVVAGNRTVKVILNDGTELAAQVLAAESEYDLAILRIQTGRKLSALSLAPASDLMVGETVIAIGHPFGYSNTVSTGIISALGRDITMPSGDILTNLIQTDASINPGNSGGPLLNINGEMIGINVALRDGAQGIAFAINTGTVKQVLGRHLSALKVAGVMHGLKCQDRVLAEIGERQRVVLSSSHPTAGLKPGDEILAVGNRAVANSFDVERALWDKQPGQQVPLRVSRNGSQFTVMLTLQGQTPTRTVADANTQPRPPQPQHILRED